MPRIKDNKKPIGITDKVYEKFEELGFEEVNRPTSKPSMPGNLSDVTPKELGNIAGKYSAWREYTDALVARASMKVMELTEVYNSMRAIAIESAEGGITQKKVSADADIDVRNAYIELMEAQMFYDLLATKSKTFSDCLTVISREISRRQQDVQFTKGF